jgi:hypothetical protein
LGVSLRPTNMMHLQSILEEYVVSARSTLDVDYDWDIPENVPFPFAKGNNSRARANMRLRRELRNAWINEPARRYELANWYVCLGRNKAKQK